MKYSGEPTHLEIGDGNTFREFVTVHRATAPGGVTRIGSGGNFLSYSHIAHDCVVGDEVIFSNNGTLAGHVEVGDRAMIGGLTAVHQFCRIGRMAITGGCSKIVQDVPPFMMVDGNPARVRHINLVGIGARGHREGNGPAAQGRFPHPLPLGSKHRASVGADGSRVGDGPEIRHDLEFVKRVQTRDHALTGDRVRKK